MKQLQIRGAGSRATAHSLRDSRVEGKGRPDWAAERATSRGKRDTAPGHEAPAPGPLPKLPVPGVD